MPVKNSVARRAACYLGTLAIGFMVFWGSAHAQIVAFGASNVSGWNVAAPETFSARLQSMLRANGYAVRVLNAGIYGNTTTDMRDRMDTDIPRGTTIVILDTTGGLYNDSMKGISREQGNADMAAIAARLAARGIRMVPVSGSDLPAQYRQRDGVHLNPQGHELVASRLLPQVMEALGPPAQAAPAGQTLSPEVVNACSADARRLCPTVLRDDAKRRACMRDHRADLSIDCIRAIARSRRGE